MAKYTPSTVGSGFNSTTELNNEFTVIADELNNKVLYRTNPSGEANQMSNDLDMNSNDILNTRATNTQELYIAGVKVNVTEFSGTNVVKFYADVAGMVAATDLTQGGLVRTKGYTTQGDGGHGLYRIVVAATGTDDGGLYHDLTGISGQAALVHSGELNVLQFGADKTGVADATSIFQAVHDALPATGGSMYAPTGTYLLNQVTTATQFNINKSNVTFRGDGWSTVLNHTASGVVTGNNAVIMLRPTSGDITNIILKDFRILGPTTNTGATIFADSRVLGIMIHDGLGANDVTDVLVESVLIEGLEIACFAMNGISATAKCERVKFSNCWARNSRQDGFNDFGGSYNTDITLDNCYATDLDGFGMEMSSSRGLSILGGVVARTGQAGIGITTAAPDSLTSQTLVSGVQVNNIGTTGYPDADGISIGQALPSHNTTISGCTVKRTEGHGITIIGTTEGVTLEGNVVQDVGGNGNRTTGLATLGTNTYLSILSNVAQTTTVGYTMTNGVSVAGSGSSTNLIQGNKIIGHTQQDISANAPTRIIKGLSPVSKLTTVGNVGVGEDDLITYTMPVYTLNMDDMAIHVVAWGTTAANANNKKVKLFLAGGLVLDTGAIAANNKDWRVEAYIYRNTSTTLRTTAWGEFNGVIIPVQNTNVIGGADFTVTNVVKCTGEATANNDIVQDGLLIKFIDPPGDV